jgi:hypothetical protein
LREVKAPTLLRQKASHDDVLKGLETYSIKSHKALQLEPEISCTLYGTEQRSAMYQQWAPWHLCEIHKYKSPVGNFKIFIQNCLFFRSFKMCVKLQISELILIMTLFYGVLDVEENYYADYSLYVPSEKQLLPHLSHSLTF